MKKILIAAAVFGALGFAGTASANVASNVFTWSGSVPETSTQAGWIIKTPLKTDIANGILVFTANAAGKGELKSSTDLAFNVFKYDAAPAIGDAAANYKFKLSSLAVNNGGLAQEQAPDGYFAIKADSAVLVKDAEVNKISGGETNLTVVPSAAAAPSNQPDAGDDVSVLATIVVVTAA